jgi:hypothetical protein
MSAGTSLRVGRRLAATLLLLAAAGCALAPSLGEAPDGGPAGTESDLPLPPPGYGTLRQEQVSVSLRSGDLQILLTPLLEPVLRASAPDTYRRLRGLVDAHSARAERETGAERPDLFLVQLYSEEQGTRFEPESLAFVSRGVRLRPDAILPLTPGWGDRRLDQRETEMALLAFEGEVDLESRLVVLYGSVESTEWTVIRPRIDAELARARARAPGG